MKVCSLYGAGFYYMPGTDICLKIGGYVRFQIYGNEGGTGTLNAYAGSSGQQDRLVGNNNDTMYRTRAVVTLDTRQQTEYGTLRTYALIGFNHDNAAQTATYGANAALYATRGFIQLAGFTFGKAQSFYDIFSNPSISYFALPGSDTGDSGMMLAAYTAQFGNGFTGTISLEDPATGRASVCAERYRWLHDHVLDAPTWIAANNNYGNVGMPDIVGVLRVDQAWGSAQIMAALHEVRPDYYLDTNSAMGHPDNKLGWIVGGGAIINASAISPGDKFQFQAQYTEGAVRYLSATQGGSNAYMYGGSTLGFGLRTDAVYSSTATGANGTSMELTKAFGVNMSYEHVWNQKWKTSMYGGIEMYSFNDNANAMICGTANAANGCNADWNFWFVGSRTQFNINSSTYLGLDVIYQKLEGASYAAGVIGGQGSHPASTPLRTRTTWV